MVQMSVWQSPCLKYEWTEFHKNLPSNALTGHFVRYTLHLLGSTRCQKHSSEILVYINSVALPGFDKPVWIVALVSSTCLEHHLGWSSTADALLLQGSACWWYSVYHSCKKFKKTFSYSLNCHPLDIFSFLLFAPLGDGGVLIIL